MFVIQNFCSQMPFEIKYSEVAITPEDNIIKTVCDYFDITVEDIKSKSRKRIFSDARAIAMYLIKLNNHKKSWAKIGQMFAGRDHSTAMFNHKKVEDLVSTNKKFRADLEALKYLVN